MTITVERSSALAPTNSMNNVLDDTNLLCALGFLQSKWLPTARFQDYGGKKKESVHITTAFAKILQTSVNRSVRLLKEFLRNRHNVSDVGSLLSPGFFCS